MAFITDKSKEEVRSRVSAYSLISQYVQLKKSGSKYKGLSPFTQEKTPSFFVNDTEGTFYCFSTSQGGDIFKFIQIKENLNFPDAIEFIANKYAISLEYEKGSGKIIDASIKKQIYDINELACAFFCQSFFDKKNSAIQDYWVNERKFTLEEAKTLRIGFAPLIWDSFKKQLSEKNFSFDALKQCGLFFSSQNEMSLNAFMPRFRGRLMIPICDIHSKVIAFTGRKTALTPTDIDYEEGKYVNSPVTPVFVKTSTLFNLDRARKTASESGYVILVEGQLDALRMSLNGFENTVAGQGTSITDTHFSLIKKFANKVIILLDGDLAGQKASMRVIPMCLHAGLEPVICVLPKGQDPDSQIVEHGAESMKALIEKNSINAIAFIADFLMKSIDASSPQGKQDVLSAIFEIIQACSSRIAQNDYLKIAANALDADYSAISQDYAHFLRNKNFKTHSPEIKISEDKSQGMLTNVEYDTLLLCLHNEDIGKRVAEIIPDEWIDVSCIEGKVLACFIANSREGIDFNVASLDNVLANEEEKNFVFELLAKDVSSNEDVLNSTNLCIERIWKKHCKKFIDEINFKITKADSIALSESKVLFEELKKWRNCLKTSPWKIE